MIVKNKIAKSFGPAGSAAGQLLFIVGLVTMFFSNVGLVLFFLGAFLGFTYTSTQYDTNKKRIKFAENTFGLLPHGKWINIEPEMQIGLSKSKQGFQVFSRSNKNLDIVEIDYRIVLYNANDEEILPVKRFKNHELAEKELKLIAEQLGVNIYMK